MNQIMTVLDFYDVDVIKMDQFWHIIQSETSDIKIIIDEITNIMKDIKQKLGYESYLVPNPKSDKGTYWTDYPYDFLTETYKDNLPEHFFRFIVYLII